MHRTVHVRLFVGYSGSGYKQLLHKSEIVAGKKSIIQIKNDDNRCMIRAIAIGQAINNNDPQLKSIKDPRIKLQLNRSMEIIKNCNLPEDGPYSINILNQVSDYIKNNIIVINGNYFNSVTYQTGKKYDKNIYLLHMDGHYDLITSLTAFYGAA